MRITAIRVGKLVSGPGFNNTRVELEAAIDSADDEDTTVGELSALCDQHVRRIQGIREMTRTTIELQEEVHRLERERDSLIGTTNRYREVVAKYERLGEMAREQGVEGADLLAVLGDQHELPRHH